MARRWLPTPGMAEMVRTGNEGQEEAVMTEGALRLFALDATRSLGDRIAAPVGVPLSAHEEREFEDGEHKARPLTSVTGADVYVIQSLHAGPHASVNDKLCRLLFFLGALGDAGAARVTAVVPYLCYARKDRKTKLRDPVTTRYVAGLFEAVGTGRVVTLDVHNVAAFQNAFRIPTVHLEARPLFVGRLREELGDEDVVVVSPDVGGVKRVDLLRDDLAGVLGRDVTTAFMEKQRSGGVVSGTALVGDVRDRVAFLVDDLIGTGTTLSRAARACREAGAGRVIAAATHGLFVGDAAKAFGREPVDHVWITDTVPPFRLPEELVRERVEVIPAAPLLGACIRRLHEGGPVEELLEV